MENRKRRQRKKKSGYFKMGGNFNKHHPTYIVDEEKNKYVYIGITHQPSDGKKANKPLAENPNPKDKKKAYVQRKVSKHEKRDFNNDLPGWMFAEKDKPLIKSIVDKYIKRK